MTMATSRSDTIRFAVPLPPRALHPNERPHHFAKARAVKKFRGSVWIRALEHRPDEAAASVAVRLHFYLRRIVKPDDDNSIAWFKPGFDALQDAGIVGNDRDITHLKPTFQRDRENPRVEVEIIVGDRPKG
jgi:Holliday junction resolvase RusA-like endonuclease